MTFQIRCNIECTNRITHMWIANICNSRSINKEAKRKNRRRGSDHYPTSRNEAYTNVGKRGEDCQKIIIIQCNHKEAGLKITKVIGGAVRRQEKTWWGTMEPCRGRWDGMTERAARSYKPAICIDGWQTLLWVERNTLLDSEKYNIGHIMLHVIIKRETKCAVKWWVNGTIFKHSN